MPHGWPHRVKLITALFPFVQKLEEKIRRRLSELPEILLLRFLGLAVQDLSCFQESQGLLCICSVLFGRPRRPGTGLPQPALPLHLETQKWRSVFEKTDARAVGFWPHKPVAGATVGEPKKPRPRPCFVAKSKQFLQITKFPKRN